MVVVVIVEQRLSQQVLCYVSSKPLGGGDHTDKTVQMMQSLNVGRISSTILWIDLHLIATQPRLSGFLCGHS